MSTTDYGSQRSDTVSLADEEEVKQVLVDSVLGHWEIALEKSSVSLSPACWQN